MTNHTDLLNEIALKIKANRYLEIGVYNPDHNFNLIAVQNKVSLDPDPKAGAEVRMTSDGFFKLFPNEKFDLIFIDGLHHADQVKRDLVNAWGTLNAGGVIVMHDCNPPTEVTTCIPRGNQREWCGDVYKTASEINTFKFTTDFDYGCTVLRKTADTLELEISEMPTLNWQYFTDNRKALLNLVTAQEAKDIIAAW